MPGIEGRLAHQPMDAGLGAQPPVGVFPLEPYGGALDARHLRFGHLDQLRVESPPLAPPQVHPEQHLGPVLRLGAARSRLDVQKRVGRIHLSGEHPAKLQGAEMFVERRHVGIDLGDGLRIGLFLSQREERLRVFQSGLEAIETLDHPG